MSEVMRSSRRGRRAMADINVVPYIDVMLVLLIIFMVTAPMVNPGVVELPTVGKSDVRPQVKPLIVTIKADESITISIPDKGEKDKPVSKTELIAVIKMLKTDKPDVKVIIAADKNVKYDIVMQVMDDLKNNEIPVGLYTKPIK